MGIGNVGRAFLLGTSALVMTSAVADADSFDITVLTFANKTLGPAAGETGTVQAGAGLGAFDVSLPAVDIVGSGATLTNHGTITAIGTVVRATGPISGVSVTNSGLIRTTIGFGKGVLVSTGADLTGGVLNQAGATISGGVTGIDVFKTSDISGGVDNSGTIFGGTIGINVNAPGLTSNPSDISGGILNQAGAAISGGVTGVHVDIISAISGGIDNQGLITGVRNQGTISRAGTAFAVTGAGADITGQGVLNEVVATISGTFAGLGVTSGANISGGVDNSGLVKGGVIGVLVTGAVAGPGIGVLNQVGGTISGGQFGIAVVGSASLPGGGTPSDISGGVDNSGTISGGNSGIGILSGSDISGGVDNGGVLSGGSFGLWVAGGSDISDAGGARGFGVRNQVGWPR